MDIQSGSFLVTGGASGLGEATVRHLHKLGANVIIADINVGRGADLVDELGDRVRFVEVDVTNTRQCQQAVDTAADDFGGLHGLISCAGLGTVTKVIDREGNALPLQQFDRAIQINLVGTFNMIRLAAEIMHKQAPNSNGERGVLINVASVAAFDGQIGQAAYSASKGGVVGMTLPIAREMARFGVRVMTIAPGLFETPMMASLPDEAKQSLGAQVPFPPRLGKPDEFALLVQQIVENPMLNGETIRLDGAIRMAPK